MAEQIEKLELSPSKVLQGAVQEIIDRNKGKMELIKANEYLRLSIQKTHQVLADFLESKKIDFTEYNQYVYNWNQRYPEVRNGPS